MFGFRVNGLGFRVLGFLQAVFMRFKKFCRKEDTRFLKNQLADTHISSLPVLWLCLAMASQLSPNLLVPSSAY